MVNTDAWECSHETFYSSNIAANRKKIILNDFLKLVPTQKFLWALSMGVTIVNKTAD